MAEPAAPLLTHVLVCLCQNLSICRIRLDRLRAARIDTEEHDRRLDEAENAVHLHPFPDFVRRVVLLTGVDKDALIKGIGVGFSDCRSLVGDLRTVEGTAALNELYAKLSREHPKIAEKCGLDVPDEQSVNPILWRRNPFYHVKEHLDKNDVRRTGTFSSDPTVLAQLGAPIALPTVTPDETELAILKYHYPAADPNSPPWPDIKAQLLAAGVPLETVHNATSRDLIRMIDRVRGQRPSASGTPDVALDDSTIATARAMAAYLQSLAGTNTAVSSMLVIPPSPNVTFAADSDVEERERANKAKLFPGGVPRNSDVVDLVVRLDAAKGSGESQRKIALEFTSGDRKRALSLLSQIRRLKREKRIDL